MLRGKLEEENAEIKNVANKSDGEGDKKEEVKAPVLLLFLFQVICC